MHEQFKPTADEQWVIRSLLNAQEAFVINSDFIIEEDSDSKSGLVYNSVHHSVYSYVTILHK